MGARHRSTSDLPHAPLQMVHPVAIPGASVTGAEMVHELPPGEGAALYSLFWAALTWSHAPDAGVPDLASAEAGALARLGQEGCWAAAAVIAGQLAGEGSADRTEMAQACFCIADWALARKARGTALAFTLLAAFIFPRHPRYAWAAGRMLRGHGRLREAEFWLDRSHRVAVWSGDAYAQSLSLSSLGMLAHIAGNQLKAERRLGKALLVASRHGLRHLEGGILHDLMIMETGRQDFARAETYAAQAIERYRPDHERLPALAHDIASLWMDQGYFGRALPVIRSVIPRLRDAAEQFQAYAGTVRAAGGSGDQASYEWAAARATECSAATGEERLRAAAFLDLGRGASSLRRWDEAATAFERAIAASRQQGESDVLFKAVAGLDAVRRREGADERARVPTRPRGSTAADTVARDMIQALQPALSTG